MTSADIYLVRHAESTGAETTDPGLSELGRRQAQLLGGRLSGLRIGAVVHSPKRRAAETAAALARTLPGVSIRNSDLLTDLTPVPSIAKRNEYPERHRSWCEQVPEDEQDEDGVALSHAFIALTSTDLNSTEEGPVVLVTHAFVIGWFVRSILQAPTWSWMRLVPSNASLTVIRRDPDGPSLLSFNDTGHLHSSHLKS